METRKFISSIKMPCTRDQYEADLKKPLEELCGCRLGGDFCRFEFIFFQYGILTQSDAYNIKKGRTRIQKYNPALFLAIAAISEKGFWPGEWVVLSDIGKEEWMSHLGLLQVKKYDPETEHFDAFIEFENAPGGRAEYFRKATLPELITHFQPVKIDDEHQQNIAAAHRISDLRPMLLTHPDQEMIHASCLHYLGDAHQKLYEKLKEQGDDWVPETFQKVSLWRGGNKLKDVIFIDKPLPNQARACEDIHHFESGISFRVMLWENVDVRPYAEPVTLTRSEAAQKLSEIEGKTVEIVD